MLFLVIIGVHREINAEQQQTRYRPFRSKVQEPGEMCAAEEEHEQRWVAQRGQQTAAVSYQRDEEKDGVNLVFTLFVGLDELLVSMSGRISSMAAPVVPMIEAKIQPKPKKPVLTQGLAFRSPEK